MEIRSEDFVPCDKWNEVLNEITNPTIANLLYNSEAFINEKADAIYVIAKNPLNEFRTRQGHFILDSAVRNVFGRPYKICARENKNSPAEELIMKAKRSGVTVEKE